MRYQHIREIRKTKSIVDANKMLAEGWVLLLVNASVKTEYILGRYSDEYQSLVAELGRPST